MSRHWPEYSIEAACLGLFMISACVFVTLLEHPLSPARAAVVLVATYISVEAPLSGMSMNSARTLGSAVRAAQWTALWVYFTAPPLGMLAAAEAYLRLPGGREVWCAKLLLPPCRPPVTPQRVTDEHSRTNRAQIHNARATPSRRLG